MKDKTKTPENLEEELAIIKKEVQELKERLKNHRHDGHGYAI